MIRIFSFVVVLLSYQYANSQEGASLNFEDTNASVRLDNALNLANQSFSIEFWAKSISNGSNHTFIGNGQISVFSRFFIGFLNGIFYFDFANNQLTSSVSSRFLWHHYALTYDASTGLKSFYLDGEIKATSISGSSFSNTAQIRLGVANNSAYLNGSMDELRIWNIVLNEEDINNRMNCELIGDESDLKAYYNFNQGIADQNNAAEVILFDRSINDYNGDLINFNLNGTSSNWVNEQGVVTGNICQTLDIDKNNTDIFQIKVFPNPSFGVLNISSKTIINKISIYNLLGQKIHEVNSNSLEVFLNLESLQSGNYTINAYMDNYLVVKKLIVQ